MAVDFMATFGETIGADRTVQIGDLHVGGRRGSGYVLTNPGYNPSVFESVRFEERFPLPAALRSIDLRRVISIGNNGTGEKDIARTT